MIAIRGEIDRVGRGRVAVGRQRRCADAPHTARALAGEWDHAVRPRRARRSPPGVDRRTSTGRRSRRIDGAYGDRNLVCACPPPEAFEE